MELDKIAEHNKSLRDTNKWLWIVLSIIRATGIWAFVIKVKGGIR
jgi:hypothetical protein